MESKLKLVALQLDLIWEQAEKNRSQISRLLDQYQAEADLIVLPETFTTGFSMQPGPVSEGTDGPTLRWMQKLAEERKAIVMGSMITHEGDKYFNRMLVVNSAGLLTHYDKRHLFRMAGENASFSEGKKKVIFNCKGWKVCPMICYDLRFPVWSRNRNLGGGQMEYDLLLYVANWPAPRAHHWQSLLKARAIENQAYVAGVNRVGKDQNGLQYSGNSMILNHFGEVIASRSGQPGILAAELESQPMTNYRSSFPIWQDADHFSIP